MSWLTMRRCPLCADSKLPAHESRQIQTARGRLRQRNRILSIHASTAIDGNQLLLDQVTECHQRQTGLGAVQGHSGGAKRLERLWRDAKPRPVVGRQPVAGTRTPDGCADRRLGPVSNGRCGRVGQRRHPAAPWGVVSASARTLVEQLLAWGQASEAHPLIISSAVHYRL